MTKPALKHWSNLLILICAFVVNVSVNAQNWPSKDKYINLIVPFPENGSTDKIARVIAGPLAEELGVEVVINNVRGLGGSIGTAKIATAPADGYTLGISTLSSFAAYPALYKNVDYHPIDDFSFIVNIAAVEHVLAVNPDFGVSNYGEFLALIKQAKEPYKYATSGAGSPPNLLMEYLQKLANVQLEHVPFKGAASAVQAAARTKSSVALIVLDQSVSILPYIDRGELIAIAVGHKQRMEQIPDVPTFAELGLAPVNRIAFYGLVAPKNIADEVLIKLNYALNKVLRNAVVQAQITEMGFTIVGGSSSQFKKDISAEVKLYKQIADKNL